MSMKTENITYSPLYVQKGPDTGYSLRLLLNNFINVTQNLL